MSIQKIQDDLKEAQLEREEIRVLTLRLLLSEIKNAQIAKGAELNDLEVTVIIQKEVKKRQEAAAGFRQGQREDDALKEEAEAKVLLAYLPEQLSDEELTKVVENSIKEVGAKSLTEMGKVIAHVLSHVAGQADGKRVSDLVRLKLNG